MGKEKIVFRVDGSAKMGLGHISRCIALAELLTNDFDITFATRGTPEILEFIGKTAGQIISLDRQPDMEDECAEDLTSQLTGEEIIVLDGYHFTSEYEMELKKSARAVVAIDDIPSRHFVCDVVFNFCGGVTAIDYSKELYTKTYTGLDYIFLRRPFLRNPPDENFYNRLFINMGGSDPNNNTLKVLKEILSGGYKGDVEVVVGSQYQHLPALQTVVKKSDSRIHQALSARDMYELMGRCSLAILPPSTVALEFLSTGGLVFLHETAGNQKELGKYLKDLQLASDYKDFSGLLSSTALRSLFDERLTREKQVFTTSTLARVRRVFQDLSLSSKLVLRKAGLADMETCYHWANDPDARQNSFSKDPIPWEEHVRWFTRKINDPDCVYFIAAFGTSDVGQVRFDISERSTFQISYSLDRQWRGKGLGTALLSKAVKTLSTITRPKKIIGYVQKRNAASVKAFQRAGFGLFETDKFPESLLFQIT